MIRLNRTQRGVTTTNGETQASAVAVEAQEPAALPAYTYIHASIGEQCLPGSDDSMTAYEHIHRSLYATRYTVHNGEARVRYRMW